MKPKKPISAKTPDGKLIVVFFLQPTESFKDGAPQREEYLSTNHFILACLKYAEEWKEKYFCAGCDGNRDCPQHGTSPLTMIGLP